MKISELIKKLQELQNEYGDVEVLAAYDDFGTDEFIPLEDGGISFVFSAVEDNTDMRRRDSLSRDI